MIILVGASASGKTEVSKCLCKYFGYKKFVTTTTRPIRIHEVNGIDYNFITLDEFKQKINNDEFIEYTIYNSNYYGTEKRLITNDSVLIVEPEGLKVFLGLNDPNIVSFFLTSSKELRKKRMELRGDKEEDIKKRLQNDELVFTDEVKNLAHNVIDSNTLNIEEMAKTINDIYQKTIKNLEK